MNFQLHNIIFDKGTKKNEIKGSNESWGGVGHCFRWVSVLKGVVQCFKLNLETMINTKKNNSLSEFNESNN